MNRQVPIFLTRAAMMASFIAISTTMPAGAADNLPKATPEGMELVSHTSTRVVYSMPGATLDGYTKVALLDCYVAFEKDWERDYNQSATFQRRVHADDMEAIKKDLADEFRKVFTEVLTESGHDIVDHTGPDVMIIRPAIVNLDVTAPDLSTAGFSTVVVRSAGSMTLYMELFDSMTGAIFARIIDAQADREAFAQRANSTTNRAAADRILKGWARELDRHLGAAKDDTSIDDK